MNPTQEITDLILRSMYADLFKGSYTQKQNDLLQSIHVLKDVSIRRTLTNKVVLTWHSKIGHDVACYVYEDGFYFSQMETYKDSTGRMRGSIKESFPSSYRELVPLLEEEIKIIKKAFKAFSASVETYFK